MTAEDQVCTVDQARQLKELGARADSLFFWIDKGEKSKLVYGEQIEFLEELNTLPAFTVAELGYLLRYLPGNVYFDDEVYIAKAANYCKSARTEAHARAWLLIHHLSKASTAHLSTLYTNQ